MSYALHYFSGFNFNGLQFLLILSHQLSYSCRFGYADRSYFIV